MYTATDMHVIVTELSRPACIHKFIKLRVSTHYQYCSPKHGYHLRISVFTARKRGPWTWVVYKNVRRILVRGSMPPCRLRRRKFSKFDYEMVHSEVLKNALFACFRFLIFHPFFQGVSWPICPYVRTPIVVYTEPKQWGDLKVRQLLKVRPIWALQDETVRK